MLDGLLNRGFSSKCKSVVKDVRRRLEVVRKRADSKQRFLKEDLVKLLANGLDINAYGRTEEYLAGLNLLACYDFIEYTCEYIVNNLPIMQKQRECPGECREAIGSLMHAAARFSDLPELRDLRGLFQERYGSDLESFVNQKFLEKLSSLPSTTEKRLQLLQDVATEFSIKWDYRGFQQRITGTSTLAQVQLTTTTSDKCLVDADRNGVKSNKFDASPRPKHIGLDKVSLKQSSREGNDLRKEEAYIPYRERPERRAGKQLPLSTNEEAAQGLYTNFKVHEREEARVDKNESLKKDDNLLNALKSGSSSGRKRSDIGGLQNKAGECHFQEGKGREASSLGKTEKSPGNNGLIPNCQDISSAKERTEKHKPAKLDRAMQKEYLDSLKDHNLPLPPPYFKSKHNGIPPPYVIKPNEGTQKATNKPKPAVSNCDGHSLNPSSDDRSIPVGSANWKQNSLDVDVTDGQRVGQGKVGGHDNETFYDDDKIPLPRPRSVRRKQHKSSSQYNDLRHVEGEGAPKRISSSRRKDNSRKGLQILFDDENHSNDEEERMMDKLLLHYSKKPSAYEGEKLRRKPESQRVQYVATDVGESSHDQSSDGPCEKSEILSPSMRSLSLPHDHTVTPEAKKIFNRANSFQPDNRARHVHPKLPEYDDLAARLAALRGQ